MTAEKGFGPAEEPDDESNQDGLTYLIQEQMTYFSPLGLAASSELSSRAPHFSNDVVWYIIVIVGLRVMKVR